MEATLQSAKSLLCERAQQIRELEEIPKILVSPDDQLEMEHRLIMENSSNIVSLALENICIVTMVPMLLKSTSTFPMKYYDFFGGCIVYL